MALFALVSAFLMTDSTILPAVLLAVQRDFQLNDIQLGWVGSLPLMVGALLGVFTGFYADRHARLPLLLLCFVLGIGAVACSGWTVASPNFAAFLAWRVVAGAATGAMFPIAFSLVADWIGSRHRALASSVIDVIWGVGMMLGPLAGAWALDSVTGWRSAHLLVAGCSFAALLIFIVFVREPAREMPHSSPTGKRTEKESRINSSTVHPNSEPDTDDTSWRVLLRTTNALLILQSLPGSLPWGLLPFWLIAFLRQQHQFGQEEATVLWELIGISAAISAIFWGMLGDFLWRIQPARVALLCAIGTAGGAVAVAYLLHVPPTTPWLLYGLTIVVGILIATAGSNSRAMVLNCNTARTRGRVLGCFNLFDTFGRSLGPLVGGLLVSWSGDMMLAMDVAAIAWLIAAALQLALYWQLKKYKN